MEAGKGIFEVRNQEREIKIEERQATTTQPRLLSGFRQTELRGDRQLNRLAFPHT